MEKTVDDNGSGKVRLNAFKKINWYRTIETAGRLVGALGIVAAALIANRFQESMTVSTLLSQREEADSNLRAGMFHDLIGPLTLEGAAQDGIQLERELLLVQLLALNFHEHFELKPLMLHLNNRIDDELAKKPELKRLRQYKKYLWGIGKKVSRTQTAMLTHGKTSNNDINQSSSIRQIALVPQESHPQVILGDQVYASIEDITCERDSPWIITKPYDSFRVTSPSGKWNLRISLGTPDWKNSSFPLSYTLTNHEKPPSHKGGCSHVEELETKIASIESPSPDENKTAETHNKQPTNQIYLPKNGEFSRSFNLNWFDFPFTDNTLLADGTRFAIVLDRVILDEDTVENDETKNHKAYLKLIWFPKDYFSARERPVNYQHFREKMFTGFK